MHQSPDGQISHSRRLKESISPELLTSLGQGHPSEEELISRDELEWAFEHGALDIQEALTLISNHKRSV